MARRFETTARSNTLTLVMFFCIAALILLFSTNGHAQELKSKDKEQILATTKKLFVEHYHFKNQIQPTVDYLDKQWEAGKYNSYLNVPDFTQALAKDLQHFTHDKHLNFFHQPAQVAKDTAPAPSIPWGLLNENFLNNGMTALQVLPGDIGYMRLQAMGWFEETMPAAFTYLKHTQALIIDLRGNGGGMLTNLISSYLLPEDSIHLITISWNARVDSIFTIRKLNGPRYLDKPVYLLTDRGTFSSAEEFAYDLQNLKRATIVGSTTGGGANPGGTIPVYTFTDGSRLDLFISMARVESPITKSNWEGKGVKPDVESLPETALQKAHILALEFLFNRESNTFIKEKYANILAKLNHEKNLDGTD